ncbi:MAG: response regulator transcription factor [Caldilineaceae bacterium]
MTQLPPSENSVFGRILVVDDEPHIRHAIAHALTLLGYAVEEVGSGREALLQLDTHTYDALLLDINMPDMNGVEVMQAVRTKNLDTAIVVLTGHGSLESAIAAIHSHVAEYLLKPASISAIQTALATVLAQRDQNQRTQQLLNTIKQAVEGLHDLDTSAHPKPSESSDQFLQVGPIRFDRRHRTVMYMDTRPYTVTLSESEAHILEAFLRHPGQLLTCRQLAATLDYDLEEYEAEELVRPHISRLRQHLRAMPGVPTMIQTVRGRGYRFSPGEPDHGA